MPSSEKGLDSRRLKDVKPRELGDVDYSQDNYKHLLQHRRLAEIVGEAEALAIEQRAYLWRNWWANKAVLPIVALLLLAGCAFEPTGAEPIEPTAMYREQWAAAVNCTGRPGDMSHIRFFVVPGPSFTTPSGPNVIGNYNHGNIFLAEPWRDNPVVLRHEMIHALTGLHDHPDHPFVHPCNAMNVYVAQDAP